MADWRTKGVVEDSEEEEDLGSNESQSSVQRATEASKRIPGDENNTHLRTEDLVEREGDLNEEHGKQIEKSPEGRATTAQVQDLYAGSSQDLPSPSALLQHSLLKSPSPSTGQTQTAIRYIYVPSDGEASSPLSDVPSVLGDPEQYAQPEDQGYTEDGSSSVHLHPDQQRREQREELRQYIDVDSLDDHEVAVELSHRRNLRKRNPIQLHPYLLEGERYRKTMKARGVRPVQLADRPVQGEPLTQGTGSDRDQGTDFLTERNTSSPLLNPHSSPLSPFRDDTLGRSSQTAQESDHQELTFDSDDHLPDINAILNRRATRSNQYGHKRRKLSHISIPDNRKQIQQPATLTQTLPPSPPTSSQSPPGQSRPGASGFRIPKGLTTLSVSTPVQSSEVDQLATRLSSSAARGSTQVVSSKSLSSRRRHRQIVVSSESSGSDPDSSSDDSTQVQHFQRRIKGVLPASWLKLDRQSRLAREPKTNAGGNRDPASPQSTEHQRGVARKRITIARPTSSPRRAGSSARASWEILDDSDQSTDDQAIGNTGIQQLLPNASESPEHTNVDNDSGSSDMEASWLDPMLPTTAPRQRDFVNKSRKKQTKLTDTFRRPERLRYSENTAYHSAKTGSGKKAEQRRKYSKPRKKKRNGDGIPRLSIVDIPSQSNEVSSKPPQFLRVAVRQARKRPDRGRHSARGKYIRLQTLQDTEDANEVLRAWRAGTIAPNQRDEAPTSLNEGQVLKERQNNQQDAITPLAHAEQENVTALNATDVHKSIAKMRSVPRQQALRFMRVAATGQSNKPAQQHPLVQRREQIHLQRQGHTNQQGGRSAQLEILEEDFDAVHPEIAFQRKLSRLDNLDPAKRTAQPTNLSQARQVARRPRKPAPNRIDVETRQYRQPVELLPIDVVGASTSRVITNSDLSSLEGLGPYGTHYATNFDVLPLQIGTYFHQSTFIGSGAFSRALVFERRDLDEPASGTTVIFGEHQWMWRHWDSQLESQLGSIVTTLSENNVAGPPGSEFTSSQTSQTLASIIRWSSRSLFFLDPIDRSPFLSKALNLLDGLRDVLVISVHSSQEQLFRPATRSQAVEMLEQLVVLACQLLQISNHPVVDDKLKVDAKTFLINCCRSLIHLLLSKGLGPLRDFQERNRQHAIREAGIQQHDMAVECTVLLKHTLNITFPGKPMFWELINEDYISRVRSTTDVRVFDGVWYDLFSLLPFLEFNEDGILLVGSRFQSSMEDWSLVKTLVARLCSLIKGDEKNPGATVNAYFRATLSRCFNLVRTWGWRKCDGILGVIFDFFAQNKLGLLRNEESIGSPRFLEQLDEEPDFSLLPGDPSFHIFLKMLALGLQGLRSVHTEKKLRSIVWRYIPNHGRTHRKEDALQQEHLDALRNHHDILCTLFWAVPPSCRPRLDLVRNLVDHASSHMEACRLNVRSWINLVRFLVSNGETASNLEPFALWYRDIVRVNLDQYRFARKEAETLYRQVNRDREEISNALLESIVASNQRQVLAILRDALSSMTSAVQNAKSLDVVKTLVQGSSVLDLLSTASFESADRKFFPVLTDCLDLVFAYIDRFTISKMSIAQQASEESQEYGDWSGFDDVEIGEATTEQSPLTFASDPIAHLLSNAFGADESPDDSLLVKIVDVWVTIANSLVHLGSKDWSAYLGSYGLWSQMRDTEQKRRYTPYFFARVIESDPRCLVENGLVIKTGWIEALVERESKLHHQNYLTAALLNASKGDTLLHNLPFVAQTDGMHDITLAELRERRMSVVATLLSNVRKVFESSDYATGGLDDTRSEYAALLKRMQAAMKANYDELQRNTTSTSSEWSSETQVVKGTYVAFVQSVVSLLQQYTSEIYPIDRFFTDSAAFPLPATDPTYVTGRLKSYSLRLRPGDTRTMKQLATFILTTSERAAVDGQQTYLVSQMRMALEDAHERSPHTAILRRVLLLCIFPVFVDRAFDSVAATLLAQPVLEVIAATFHDLTTKLSPFDRPSVEAAIELCTSILHLLHHSVQRGFEHEGLLSNPHSLRLVASVYKAAVAIVPIVDYLHRATGAAWCAYNAMTSFVALGLWMKASLHGAPKDDLRPPLRPCYSGVADSSFSEIRKFCSSELGRALEKGWTLSHGNLYWGTRGGMRQEVVTSIVPVEDEQARLSKSIEDVVAAVEAMPSKSGGRPWLKPKMSSAFL